MARHQFDCARDAARCAGARRDAEEAPRGMTRCSSVRVWYGYRSAPRTSDNKFYAPNNPAAVTKSLACLFIYVHIYIYIYIAIFVLVYSYIYIYIAMQCQITWKSTENAQALEPRLSRLNVRCGVVWRVRNK